MLTGRKGLIMFKEAEKNKTSQATEGKGRKGKSMR